MRPAWTPAEGSLLPRGTISKEGMEKALGQRYWERQVWCMALLVSRLSLQHQTPALRRPTLEPSLGRANLQAQARTMALHDMQDLTSWRPEQHLMFSSPYCLTTVTWGQYKAAALSPWSQCPHQPTSAIQSLVAKVWWKVGWECLPFPFTSRSR